MKSQQQRITWIPERVIPVKLFLLTHYGDVAMQVEDIWLVGGCSSFHYQPNTLHFNGVWIVQFELPLPMACAVYCCGH